MNDITNGTPNTGVDDFDLEFRDATEKVTTPLSEDELPEKYRGKTAAEIARMHMNAEKKLSQTGQELGTLRTLADQVLNLKKENVQKVPETPRKPITVDEIFADPDKAIQQTIGQSDVAKKADEASSKVDNLERQLALKEFEARHPSYKNDLQDPAFQDWVASNSARVELFRRADSFDVASADALWQMWGEYSELRQVKAKREQAETKRREVLNAGKTVSDASTEAPVRGPTYSRAKLMELQMQAHGGNQAARARWNDPAFQEELLKAYSEGRVR
jgi:hypothetical protein